MDNSGGEGEESMPKHMFRHECEGEHSDMVAWSPERTLL